MHNSDEKYSKGFKDVWDKCGSKLSGKTNVTGCKI